MDFVDGNGRLEPVFLRLARKPIGVLPFVMIEARYDGAGVGAQFGAKGVGIGLQRKDVAVWTNYLVFVNSVSVVTLEDRIRVVCTVRNVDGLHDRLAR